MVGVYLSILLEHDVVVVPVPDAEDVHGDGVAAAGEGEPLEGGCKVGGVGVVALQPLVDQVLLER